MKPTFTDSDTQTTADWFNAAVPVPTEANWNAQLGTQFEEMAELCSTLSADSETFQMLVELEKQLDALAKRIKSQKAKVIIVDHVEFLDAQCDIIVTAIGSGHMRRMNVPGALGEVNRSNFSKFVNGKPVFDEHMKIVKGENYFKPDLKSFI